MFTTITNVLSCLTQYISHSFKSYASSLSWTGSALTAKEAGMATESNPDDLQTFLVAFFTSQKSLHVRQRRSASGRERKRGGSRSQDLSSVSNVDTSGNYYSKLEVLCFLSCSHMQHI